MLCIKSLQGDDRIYPLEGFKFSLGSSRQCDIIIEDGMLHDVHSLLWVGKDFITVMTVDDAVITVNGELITDRTVVKPGEKIAFADKEMEVVEIQDDTQIALPESNSWMIISRNQETKGQQTVIEGECTIGRAKENTLCIPVISLSRHHATLQLDNNGLLVSDNQSANGTFVNNKAVKETPVRLYRGDIIAFDELEFLVHGPEENIYSETTEVRGVRSTPIAHKPGPTAIDRQKISLVDHKPGSFTQRFKAIEEEKTPQQKILEIAKKPVVWFSVGAFILLFILIANASS